MSKATYNGTTLADSNQTEQVEGNQYFPRDDVDMSLFKESSTQYTCPWKGDAQYFHLEVDGETVEDAAWSYPEPKEAAKNISGHLAFDKSKGVNVS